MSPLLNKLLIVLGISIVAFGAYYFYVSMSSSDPASNTVGVVTDGGDLAQTSEKIYTDLNKIRTITIGESLFSDKRFTSLTDTRVTLGEVATGRPNPFAPVE